MKVVGHDYLVCDDKSMCDVFYLPAFKYNLVSVAKLTQELSCSGFLIQTMYLYSPFTVEQCWGLIKNLLGYTFLSLL